MRTRWLSRAVTAAVLVAAVGCGASAPAGESVPALRTQLSRVDSALADGQYGSARTALDALVRETVAAREAGRISAEQASRILAAAARLAADLPAQPPAKASPSPTPSPSASRPAPAGDSEEGNKDKDKKDEEKKDDGGGGGG